MVNYVYAYMYFLALSTLHRLAAVIPTATGTPCTQILVSNTFFLLKRTRVPWRND